MDNKPRCPGQDMRYWKPEDIFGMPCPTCGEEVEFWKDEPVRVCSRCAKELRNPRMDLGCAKWCRFAADCVGELPLRERLIAEMRAFFGADEAMVEHTLRVLGHAEEILEAEGGDGQVVRAAAILHDVGIPAALRRHGSSAGPYQECEGAPIARAILERLGVDGGKVEHVCRIVGSHHSGLDIDSPEFRIVWDADRLANFSTACGNLNPAKATDIIETTFRTRTGRKMARRLHGESQP